MDRSSIWKILLSIAIFLLLSAFILGWIGFSVPDWQQFQRYNNSIVEFYGLWAYCQQQTPQYTTVCQRWPTAESQLFNGSRPSFIRTSEGLITTGMIFLSFGFIVAVFAIVLPFIAYLAAVLTFIAFIFLIVGLPIFGRQSNNLSAAMGDATYSKRYGFWLMVPTIVFEFLAILLLLATAILYKLFGYGNLLTSFSDRIYGGRQMFGPANMLSVSPFVNTPYGSHPLFGSGRMVPVSYSYPLLAGQTPQSLLSQNLAQRTPQPYDPIVVQPTGVSVLPQPSFVRAIASRLVPDVTPAYIRVSGPFVPSSAPIINLTGETLVGSLVRTA